MSENVMFPEKNDIDSNDSDFHPHLLRDGMFRDETLSWDNF